MRQQTIFQNTPDDLPFGWEQRFASPQFYYYVDHLTGAVRLSKPTGERRIFLRSQPNIAKDITALPTFRPPEATYSALIDQLISIYRSPRNLGHSSEKLIQVLLDPSRPRGLPNEKLRENLHHALQDNLDLYRRDTLEYVLSQLAPDRSEGDQPESLNDTCTLWYIPAQNIPTSFTSTSFDWISGCKSCVESSPGPVPRTSLKNDHAWCYLCMMDFSTGIRDTYAGKMYNLMMRSCGHLFHSRCLMRYVHGGTLTCPLCPLATTHESSNDGNKNKPSRSQSVDWRPTQPRRGTQERRQSADNFTPTRIGKVVANAQISSQRSQGWIAHPLAGNEGELARLRVFGRKYLAGHLGRDLREWEPRTPGYVEHVQREQERVEQERRELARREQERQLRERQERERQMEELRERERRERERIERELQELERQEKMRREQERLEQERREQERIERERMERERREQERSERERRVRERRERERRERERREQERAEQEEVLRHVREPPIKRRWGGPLQERLSILAQFPLMLYIPRFKGTDNSPGSAVVNTEQWEDQWIKCDLPFLQLEEHRSGCSICLIDFDEPRRVDRPWDSVDDGPEPIRLLPCNHACHNSCFNRWFLTNDTCPYCRMNIFYPSPHSPLPLHHPPPLAPIASSRLVIRRPSRPPLQLARLLSSV